MAKAPAKAGGLAQRMKAAAGTEYAVLMGEDDDRFEIKEWFDTGNLLLNALISADPYKGVPGGKIIQLAGPNSVGKTYFCLELLKATQKAGYFNILYDSEFANNNKQDLIKRGLDLDNLLWVGVDIVERLKTSVLKQLDEIQDGEKVAMMIDSIGNLSTIKEVTDSTEGNDKKDMTRAQQLKALFRTCTLKAGVKGVPMFLVNHVYAVVGSNVPTNQVGGGSGSLYMSSIILELSKAQDKNADGEIVGTWITCKSVKNRFARERQKIKVNINFKEGLGRYSGLFEFFYDEEEVFTRSGNYYKNPWTDHSLLKKDFTPEVWEEILKAGGADYLRNRFAYQSDAIDIPDEEETEPELLTETKKKKGGTIEIL